MLWSHTSPLPLPNPITRRSPMSTAQGAVRQSDWIAVGVWDWLSSSSVANQSSRMHAASEEEKLRSCSHEVLIFSGETKTRLDCDPASQNILILVKRAAVVWRTSVCWQIHYTTTRLWKVAFTFFPLLSPHISLFHSLSSPSLSPRPSL